MDSKWLTIICLGLAVSTSSQVSSPDAVLASNDILCVGKSVMFDCVIYNRLARVPPNLEANNTNRSDASAFNPLTKTTPINTEGQERPFCITIVNTETDAFQAGDIYAFTCTVSIQNKVIRSNTLSKEAVGTLQAPNVTNVTIRSMSITFIWKQDLVCFEESHVNFNIVLCPDQITTTCTSTIANLTNHTFHNLNPTMTYEVSITAQCVENNTIRSDQLKKKIQTLVAPMLKIMPQGKVCYDRQVQLTCHHHDITDTTSSGPIFNQTSPVVWMKDGERIDLLDTVVSQSNNTETRTVVSVTTRKSVFLNGEANYSCAVVYADGSMEESEPVTVEVGAGVTSAFPNPPKILNINQSEREIIIQLSYNDDCFENHSVFYLFTLQEIGSKDATLMKGNTTNLFYEFKNLKPHTKYNITVKVCLVATNGSCGAFTSNSTITTSMRSNAFSKPLSSSVIFTFVFITIILSKNNCGSLVFGFGLIYFPTYLIMSWLLSGVGATFMPILGILDNTSNISLRGPTNICHGETVHFICSHPVLDKESGYHPVVFWRKNYIDLAHNANYSFNEFNATETALVTTASQDTFRDNVAIFHCLIIKSTANAFSISNDFTVEIPRFAPPTVINTVRKIKELSVYWNHTVSNCYINYTFEYTVTICKKKDSFCLSTIAMNHYRIFNELEPSTEYQITLQAFSGNFSGVFSDTVQISLLTLNVINISVNQETFCYDQTVIVICSFGDLTNNGPIYRKINPVVLLWNNDRYPLEHHYVANIIASENLFENNKANILCAVVYSDGSMETSETISINGTSVYPPQDIETTVITENSISLKWKYLNHCPLANCTSFSFSVQWSLCPNDCTKDVSEQFYKIEGLAPNTSYTISVSAIALCKPERSEAVYITVKTLPRMLVEASDDLTSLFAFVAVLSLFVLCLSAVTLILIIIIKRKRTNNF